MMYILFTIQMKMNNKLELLNLKFTQHKSDNTLITLEVPSTAKLYPTMIKKEVAEKYLKALPDKILSVGRIVLTDMLI